MTHQRAAPQQTTPRCSVFVIGPDKKVKAMLTYPMTSGRNFDEVLRLLDSCQLTAKHQIATPVNWKSGEDVIIAGSVSDEQAREKYPGGWKAPNPICASCRSRIRPPLTQPSGRVPLFRAARERVYLNDGGEAPRQIFAIAPRADRSLGSQMSGGLQKCFDYLGASPFVGLCDVTCDGQCGQVEFQPQAGQSRMGGKPRLRA